MYSRIQTLTLERIDGFWGSFALFLSFNLSFSNNNLNFRFWQKIVFLTTNKQLAKFPKNDDRHKSSYPHQDFAENFQISFMGFWENFLTWNFFFHAAERRKKKSPFKKNTRTEPFSEMFVTFLFLEVQAEVGVLLF